MFRERKEVVTSTASAVSVIAWPKVVSDGVKSNASAGDQPMGSLSGRPCPESNVTFAFFSTGTL